MNCELVIRDLPLYIYGELPPESEENVEQHLAECVACHREQARLIAMHRALDTRAMTPSPALLSECRRELMSAVYRDEASAGLPASLSQSRPRWSNLSIGLRSWFGVPHPLGALALVALGFFTARFTPRGPAAFSTAGFSPDVVTSSVRSVQPDPSGRVQIMLDETRRRIVTGRLEEEGIQRLLLAAVRDVNPGLRVESMEMLKNYSASAQVHAALLQALRQDPNAGVRLKAIEGLRSVASDVNTRKTLADVLLHDENPGVRIQAIELLTQQRDDELVGLLQSLMHNEENSYVRLRCQSALRDMNASVGVF